MLDVESLLWDPTFNKDNGLDIDSRLVEAKAAARIPPMNHGDRHRELLAVEFFRPSMLRTDQTRKPMGWVVLLYTCNSQ